MKNSTIAWLGKHGIKRPAGFYSRWEPFCLGNNLMVGGIDAKNNLTVPIKSGEWLGQSYNRIPKEDFDFMVEGLADEGKQHDQITDPVEEVINQITCLFQKFDDDTAIANGILGLGVLSTNVAVKLTVHWPHIKLDGKREIIKKMLQDRIIRTKYTDYISAIENLKKEEWVTKCFFFAMVHSDFANDVRFQSENLRNTILGSQSWNKKVSPGYFLGLLDKTTRLAYSSSTGFEHDAEMIANKPYDIVTRGRHQPNASSIKHMPNSGTVTGVGGLVVGCPWSDSSYTLKIIRDDEGAIIFIGSILYNEQ